MSKKEIILGGLDCAHCAEVINDKVSKLEEIESCNLNFINKKLTIEIACDLEIDKDDEDNLYLVIHSGSRNLGKQVCEYYTKVAKEEYLKNNC